MSLDDSGASLVLAGGEFVETAAAAARAVGAALVDVDELPKSAPCTWNGPAGAEAAGRLALVAYTSGTTGFPKGSTVTNGGLMTRFAQWSWTFGLSPSQALSTPGPVFHMSYGGLSLAHLASGGRNRLMLEF